MPLLGGVAVGGEKNAVILDFGEAYTKCGFSGENGPRCIIPSEIKRPKTEKIVRIHQPDSTEELYPVLVDFIHTLYFRHLLVNPKERRVVIVESVLCPSLFRNTLARALYEHYEVPSILFAPSHLVSLFTLGIPSGLVMDAGYRETLVLPVYEGTPILKAWEAIPVAAKSIHNYLESQLLECGTVQIDQTEKPLPAVMDSVPEHILEDIKVRCCFVTKIERAREIAAARLQEDGSKIPPPPPSVKYPLDGKSILNIEGKIREHTCEILFEQDNEEKCIASLLLDAIIKCPIDIRHTMAQNIVLIGGTCMLPGFCHRLQVEVQELLARPKYRDGLCVRQLKFHIAPTKSNYTAWLGGAIFGALEVLGSRSYSRESYEKTRVVPDWSSLHDTEETDEKVTLRR